MKNTLIPLDLIPKEGNYIGELHNMAKLDHKDETLFKDITDVWNISKNDLKNINETILNLEDDLNNKHKGRYFDYQLVDDFFQGLPDIEKAMIFVYGQMVHERFYKKKTYE